MNDRISELDELLNNLKNDKREEDTSDISFKKESVAATALKERIDDKPETEKPVEEANTVVEEVEAVATEPVVAEIAEKENAKLPEDMAEKTVAEPPIKQPLKKADEKPVKQTSKQSVKKVEKTPAKQRAKKSAPKDNKAARSAADDEQKTMVVKKPVNKSEAAKKQVATAKNTKQKKDKKGKKQANNSSWNNSIFGGLFVAFAVVIAAFIIALGGISLGKEYLGIDKDQNDITFNIPKGSTGSDIAELLEENNIIDHKTFFKLVFKLKAPDTIYPGDITLQPSMGYSAIITKLSTMRESYETSTISFPEGVTLLEVANLLEKNNICEADEFLFEFNKKQGYDFEDQINGTDDAFYAMEGYFFPDTYEFYQNDSGYNITKIVREHFQKKFTDKMTAQMNKQGLTMNQLMTLASMVQWESGSVEDMPKVASVFLNRLNDPETFPRFESDATAKYIEKVIKKQADTTASLEHYTESYDTYEHRGLPAGPVCNPGIEAINAVLNPEKTDYYYFCNNLKTGESFFAKTLEEHEQNLVKAGLA